MSADGANVRHAVTWCGVRRDISHCLGAIHVDRCKRPIAAPLECARTSRPASPGSPATVTAAARVAAPRRRVIVLNYPCRRDRKTINSTRPSAAAARRLTARWVWVVCWFGEVEDERFDVASRGTYTSVRQCGNGSRDMTNQPPRTHSHRTNLSRPAAHSQQSPSVFRLVVGF